MVTNLLDGIYKVLYIEHKIGLPAECLLKKRENGIDEPGCIHFSDKHGILQDKHITSNTIFKKDGKGIRIMISMI